jgi:hypothetical protein
MLSIEKNGKIYDVSQNGEIAFTIDPSTTPTLTNKYQIIITFIENVSKEIPEFEEWFVPFLKEYETSESRFDIMTANIDKIMNFVDKYMELKKLDFSKFVDESKAKKNSILFSAVEIEKIIKLSNYLKIYSVISNSEKLKLDHRLHGKIYNLFARNIDDDLAYKIFNVVKTKTYRYNLTDRYMWDYIKIVQCKGIDVHVIHIYNFIMNNIIILCEEDKNPITYFVTVIDESVKWFLRSVYKSSIIYDDSVSTEDIQSVNKDNLKTYSYNDTLGRLKGIAYSQIHHSFEKPILLLFDKKADTEADDFILEFQRRVEDVKFISPFCEYIVFPILSKVTNIPYNHMKTLSPEHAIVLSVYIQNLLTRVFGDEYKTLFSMLHFYPETQTSLVTTYKMKNIQLYINLTNETKNFLGFETKILLSDILSNFVGKISRADFVNVLDGSKLAGIPLSKIEADMITFFVNYFSGKLDPYFAKIKKIVEMEF